MIKMLDLTTSFIFQYVLDVGRALGSCYRTAITFIGLVKTDTN